MANLTLQGLTNPTNSFYVESSGLSQGFAVYNPDTYWFYKAGKIAKDDGNVYYGGLPVQILASSLGSSDLPSISLAINISQIDGFTIFNQSNNLTLIGCNDAPIITGGGTINTVKKGIRVKLAVKCDPTLRSKIGNSINAIKLSWDFAKNMLIEATEDATSLDVTLISLALNNSRIVKIENNTYKWSDGETCALIEI